MAKNKDETITIRTTHEIKELLRQAAHHERRSIASMIEILILAHAKKYVLSEENLAPLIKPQKRA